MSSMDSSKKTSAAKEEGELSDDEEEENKLVRRHNHAHFSPDSRRAFRYVSAEQTDNYELGDKYGSKRKDYRRRMEADSRRSSRNAASGGAKKHHKEHQQLRQAVEFESCYTPSKFWANRRFRASSVRPLSPRDERQPASGRTDAPQTLKHRGQEGSTEGPDELERLEQEQRRIREQLKSLEEEELNNRSNDNDCALGSLDTRLEAGDDLINALSGSGDGAELHDLLEADKSEDEDIDVQELRRLALATSERHIRLMASEPQPLHSDILSSDVVVIPDVEPDSPDPVVVMVDEEEDSAKNQRRASAGAAISGVECLPAKTKHQKSTKLKKARQPITAADSEDQHSVRVEVTVPSCKKSRGKKRKKTNAKQVEEWNRQREELKILVMDNPAMALEKLLKFASEWQGSKQPIVTGTIKDFKRQKQLPVLSDKRAVQHFSQTSAGRRPSAQEKATRDKQSGQLQDNYEEVEMDIESGNECEEIGDSLPGYDLNQVMLPFYHNTETQGLLGAVQHTLPVSTGAPCPPHFLTPPVIHFAGIVQPPPLTVPPLPTAPPPPPPPLPPAATYELEWNSMQERQIEVVDHRGGLGRREPHNLIYCDSAPADYQGQQDSFHGAADVTSQPHTSDPARMNNLCQNVTSSLDDDIARWLRMIRQNQDSNSPDFSVHTFAGQRFVIENHQRQKSLNLLPSADHSNSSEDILTADLRSELYSSLPTRNSSQQLPDSDSFHKLTHSPSVSSHRSQLGKADTFTYYSPSEVDKNISLSPRHRGGLPRNDLDTCVSPVQSVSLNRSVSFSRRGSLGEYVRSRRDISPQSDLRRPLTQSQSKHDSLNSSPQSDPSRPLIRSQSKHDALYSSPQSDPSRPLTQSQSKHDFLYSSPQSDPSRPLIHSQSKHDALYSFPQSDPSRPLIRSQLKYDSLYSSPQSDPSRPLTQSKYDSQYSSPQCSVARQYPRGHVRDKASANSDYLSQLRLHETSGHRSSPPHPQVQKRRSHSTDKSDMYEPQVPATKKLKRASPPPYIPTSIKPARTFTSVNIPQQDSVENSDSEEEDPIALRNKLLAEVIEKRKSLTETVSSNTATPDGMSPRQESTHTQSFEAGTFPDRFKSSTILGRVSEEEKEMEDDEDIKPPPVINRRVRQNVVPATLAELCTREVCLPGASAGRQERNLELQDQGQPIPRGLGEEYFPLDTTVVEDNEGLSNSDLQILRDFILRAQRYNKQRQSLSLETNKDRQSLSPETNKQRQSLSPESKSEDQTPQEMLCSTAATAALSVLERDQSDFVINVSSSSWNNSKMNVSEDPQMSSGESLLSAALGYSVPASAHGISPPHVTSSMPSSIIAQPPPKLVGIIKTADATSSSVCSHIQSPLVFSKPPALSDISAQTPAAKVLPVTSEPEAVPQDNLASGSDHFLSSVTAHNVDTATTEECSTPVRNLHSQNSERKLHFGPRSKQQDYDTSESQISSAADGTSVLLSDSVSNQHGAVVRTTQQRGSAQVSISDSTALSFSDRPSLPYSSHAYSSFASRKYPNVHALPVHPKVLVPMNSSSDSDGESHEENDSQTSAARAGHGGKEKTVEMLATSSSLVTEMQENKKAAAELLGKQEKLLSAHEQSIQKDQKMVKQLVRRTVKFLEAQQQEEQKRQSLHQQLLDLSREMKKTEKLVMMFKAEKEKTEKQVQLVTETLLQKKKQYERKARSVMSLGCKLLGPSYVSNFRKPHVTMHSALTVQEKQNVSRAQHIAQEKLKLIEKEKQIAEKLRKLKEAQGEKDTNMPTSVKHVPDLLKSVQPKWKSQDVIRIERDVQPDVPTVKQRRKSLLDMNMSTTPNIPLTPHRAHSSSSSAEKEYLSKTKVEMKQQDHFADLSSAFRMPGGTQLANFCKLQREKTVRFLQNPYPSPPLADLNIYTNLTAWQKSTAVMRLHSTERTNRLVEKDSRAFVNTCQFYTSPLLVFRSYRLNSFFRTKENLSLQSSTYSHKINPNSVLCPYDLQGTCSDDSCKQLHPRDYKLSDHELLEEIVSYCPKLAGAADGASPEEVQKCIVTFVDNILRRHKSKMTTDDLCLWLLSQVNEASGKRHPHTISLQPRVWKPQPKEELGLSLDLDQKLTSHGVEALNVDRRFADKDGIVGEEDMRYFTADATETVSLEADLMAHPTDAQLWLKLANKTLSDSNRCPKECLDQALSVLARGLEMNRNNPDLWHQYLTLYKRHPEVKDFPELCHTALGYAPSYELWFLYLESVKTYTDKDRVSSEALHFLCQFAQGKETVAPTSTVRPANDKDALESYSTVIPESVKQSEVSNFPEVIERNQEVSDSDSLVVFCDRDQTDSKEKSRKASELKQNRITRKIQDNQRNQNNSKELGKSPAAAKQTETCQSQEQKRVSHQVLEMVLYKTCLNLQAGRIKTALHFLQMVLGLKKPDSSVWNVTELLKSADLLVLWMSYIYVLEWHQLPHMYSWANQNPGRLLAKESISLPWSLKSSLCSTVEHLVKLHQKAALVWDKSLKDEETTVYYVKLIESQVSLLKSQNRHADAMATCRHVLKDSNLVDVWLLLADLCASVDETDTVKRVFTEAVSANKHSPKLQYYLCTYLYKQGEAEVALKNLQQFALGHFDISSRNILPHDCCQLYSQLLKQEEAFTLRMAPVKEGLADGLTRNVYMWLCYSLLVELQEKTEDVIEVLDSSLTHAQTPRDLTLVWQHYIFYLARHGSSLKDTQEMVMRSLISMPVKFPVPFSPLLSATWVDYYYSNLLVEAWLLVLSPEDSLDLMEMSLTFMPNNVQLLLRAIELSLRQQMTRRAYSWCRFVAAQRDRPANLAFWKMATALAQVEGTPREVENLLVASVETMPLAVSAWKDLLLFEVTRENPAAVHRLLTYCQQLQLNIEGFVATLSASTS